MKLRKDVYITAGFNTVSFGSGRKEFHPKKARPGLEHYIKEAGEGVLAQINDPELIDEGVISNFMAARFNRQGNLAGLIPTIHPSLEYKPSTRVEGACGSGGLGLYTGMKSVLAETADVVLVLGTEVQNTVKAIYGADILAGAGHYASERKDGHAYFFPGRFSERAQAYQEKFGVEQVREAMARWYEQCVTNARNNPKAQEHHNSFPDLFATGMTPPNPKAFLPHLNVFDCSKVSDGASACLVCSEEGLKKLGIDKSQAVLIKGFGQCEADLTRHDDDKTKLKTSETAASRAYEMAGLKPADIGVVEVHDCFTITGLLMLEATGFAEYGKGGDLVTAGETKVGGSVPTNATGGLVGFGHYTGGTGIRQAVDILHQLSGQAPEGCQIDVPDAKRNGILVSMGGNDKTVTSMILGN
jgi:acetyl-CoA C-acetyltransferase/acetyl-CoA acyltransferase